MARIQKGQSIVEYLIFFVIFAAVTVFAVGLLPNSRRSLEEHFQTAVRRITATR